MATLYAGQGSTHTTTDLYSVDPVTGVCTSIGPVGFGLTGIAADPTTGLLYGATNSNSGSDPNSLLLLNPSTGAGSLIGAFGHIVSDLAFDASGQLYGVDPSLKKLLRINKATGGVTVVGNIVTSGSGTGFAIDSVGNARLFQSVELYSIDLTTAAEATIGTTGFINPGAASYDSSDVLWVSDTDNSGNSSLYTVNPATAAAVLVAALTITKADALGWGTGGGPSGPVITSFDPPSGPIGTEVTISGSGFTGATDVEFDGTSAVTFTVDSDSSIRARVPAGAHTGLISVTTPDGTAFSATAFVISPSPSAFRSPLWEFVVLNLATFEILSFLNQFCTGRTVTLALNQPAVAVGQVPADNPEVNIPWPTIDDDPFLSEGTRVLYGFRREGTLDDPPIWVPRFAGLIMQLEDTAESEVAYSHFTAYDPWQYLLSRPVCNSDGSLPGPDGLSFTATRADVIIGELLANTIANQGDVGIDAGLAYGGTGLFTGTIEPCEAIDINFAQGTSVGQAWQTLTQQNLCDIILTPIYDPGNRNGYLVQLNVYTEAGAPRDNAIFAWDRPSRSLVGISRLIEGSTQRANAVKYFAGQGGSAPGGQTITLQEDAASIAKFGEYWRQQFFPSQTIAAVVQALARAQLDLATAGRVTVAFSPAPERSPLPFTEYFLGDRVPVYASERFRAPIPAPDVPSSDTQNYQRVYGIPLVIGDDSVERVQQLLTAIPS